MDGSRETPAAAAAAASVSSVLGDDDLFREILLRLGFANCLVRASLVSKRWLFQASDPAFLHLFRERHPPRLLGFCVGNDDRYQFVQLEQFTELAALSRRVASSCNDAFGCRGPGIGHSRNGRLITTLFHDGRVKRSLLSPLLSGESEVASPWYICGRLKAGWKVRAEVYLLGSGCWRAPTTAVTEVPNAPWQGFHGDQLWVHPGSIFGCGKVPHARAPRSTRR